MTNGTITIRPNPLEPFKVLYNLPPDTWMVINIGGRGGGKSHETSKLSVIQSCCYGKRIAVLRDEKVTIEQSIMNDIKSQFKRIDEATSGYFSKRFIMNDNELKQAGNNQSLIFTMGFRASSNAKATNLKSISEIDIALIEEFEDIRDEFKFNVFADGIRKAGSYILINSNVPDKDHWFLNRYFTLEPTDYDGYFQLMRKNIKGVVYIFSSYENNPYLPPHIVAKYRGYGDKDSPFYDPHYYYSQILGYASSGRIGRIYTGWQRISFDLYKQLDYNKYYYIDWGTRDPCAIGEVKIHNRNLFVKPLLYEPKEVIDIAKFLCDKGFTEKDIIICDSSEPNSILKLRNGYTADEIGQWEIDLRPQLARGFSTIGVAKPSGSVIEGISLLKEYTVHVVEGEEGDKVWAEYIDYRWHVDKNGNSTDQPIDKNNHHMDGIRYVPYMLPVIQ